ncbi:MAG: hypothetical protein WCU00_03210 [Candidatus Latescibacterota bacterium]
MLMKRVNMKKGHIDSLLSNKSSTSSRPKGDLSSDWPRLALLLLVMAGFGIGFIVNVHSNNPKNILRDSVRKMEKQTFRASIEGKTSLRDSTLAQYRYRQLYAPGKGISTIFNPSESKTEVSLNALSLLKSLRNPEKVKEDDRQDMYGHPTRHFYGVTRVAISDNAVSSSCYFEYWIDMRDLRAVRISFSKADRNSAVDSAGNSISTETYLNIRYW